jgi:hypothetical protein
MGHIHSRGRVPARIALALCGAGVLLLTALVAPAAARDRNDDHIPDRWEKRHDLSLKVDQSSRDQDTDELRNLGEYRGGTDPRDADSDGDGIPDGAENAGVVDSFTPGAEEGAGTLVIDLDSGGSLTGEVTADTRILCSGDPAEEGEPAASQRSNGAASPEGGPQPPGESPDGDGHGHGCSNAAAECTTAELVPGAVVLFATIEETESGVAFQKIVLGE